MTGAELRTLLTEPHMQCRAVSAIEYGGHIYMTIEVTPPPPPHEAVQYVMDGLERDTAGASNDPSQYVDVSLPEHTEPLNRSARGIFRSAILAIASMLRGGSTREMK
jgi:hypothetical protein